MGARCPQREVVAVRVHRALLMNHSGPGHWAPSSVKPSWTSPLQQGGLPPLGGQRAVCLGRPLGDVVLGVIRKEQAGHGHHTAAPLRQLSGQYEGEEGKGCASV